MVLGARVDPGWVNEALGPSAVRRGAPLPWTIGPPASPAGPPGAPLRVSDHPAARALAGDDNPLRGMVVVTAARKLGGGAVAADQTAATIVASSGGSPLVWARGAGRGRFVALLTAATPPTADAPAWSNLATLPVFPVMVNDLVAWAAAPGLRPAFETIGEPPAAGPPGDRPQPRRSELLCWTDQGGFEPAAELGANAVPLPAEPGVYRRKLGGRDGPPFAAGPDPRESDLRRSPDSQTQARLRGVARYGPAGELFREDDELADPATQAALGVALLAALAAERLVAYRASNVASAVPGRARA